MIHANFMMLSHVSIIILHHFYAFCRTNLLTRCQVPVPYFCCFSISEKSQHEISSDCLKIYGDFLCDGRHQRTKGRPGGPPRGQRRVAAVAPLRPAGGARPRPLGTAFIPKNERAAIIFQRSHPDAPSSQTLFRG